jgi:uncharacterized protein (DUF433 family)
MTRYSLNLPAQLKQAAEDWAARQGVSLNQFILWAVSEKVGALTQQLDDPAFPQITYRRGASGLPAAVLRGTGIRVQTIVIAQSDWGMSLAEIAEDYDLGLKQVEEALAFYRAHRPEIEAQLALEHELANENHGQTTPAS